MNSFEIIKTHFINPIDERWLSLPQMLNQRLIVLQLFSIRLFGLFVLTLIQTAQKGQEAIVIGRALERALFIQDHSLAINPHERATPQPRKRVRFPLTDGHSQGVGQDPDYFGIPYPRMLSQLAAQSIEISPPQPVSRVLVQRCDQFIPRCSKISAQIDIPQRKVSGCYEAPVGNCPSCHNRNGKTEGKAISHASPDTTEESSL
jgi:hypothetical protein